MKELLAKQLLAEVMSIDDLDDLGEVAGRLTTLCEIKYDDYGGYSPGVKFIESLAVWLAGFDQQDRQAALDFVLNRLTYVSEVELDHLISTVYKDLLRPHFIRKAADELGIPRWAVKRVTSTLKFKAIQRRTLILGMSDGARLDKLRRFSSLSTEQFHLVSVLDKAKQDDMKDALEKALKKLGLSDDPTFSSVVVVDDFSGSGTTMLRWDEDSKEWKGKLPKLREHIAQLKSAGIVAQDASVVVLLYLISHAADEELNRRIVAAGYSKEFELRSAHKFSEDFPLNPGVAADVKFWELCDKYFRSTWPNEHSKIAGDLPHGYGGSALPLVLHHNAPNNAPPIMWKDELSDEQIAPFEREWIGVFPRYERHHPGRP